ncbi:MAG: hypothetical protein WCP16_02535 [Pseudanabaena sp. ELA645]|jgi:hypothetical protein
MDATVAVIFVVGIFGLIIVIAFLKFQKQGHAEIKGPFGTSLRVAGSNERSNSRNGIRAKGVRSRAGGMRADEKTGSGIDVENIDARDDVILSSSNAQSSIASNISGITSTNGLSAQALNAGGSITIQQFVGNQSTLAEQLAFFVKQIGITNPRQDYANSQFEAYCNAWKSLQALRLAGDDLWERASEDNLLNFANQLRSAKITVNEGEIFFEERDLSHLVKVLDAFSHFRLGKVFLLDIRSRQCLREVSNDQEITDEKIAYHIERNHTYKIDYERILKKVGQSFREKLSS